MADFLTTIVETKREEVAAAMARTPEPGLRRQAEAFGPRLPFEPVMAKPGPSGVNIIAEIKRASPSKGSICEDLDAAAYAGMYEQSGAAAVSVLTDTPYFKGSLADLETVKARVSLPVLRKEFIISPYQIYEAAAAGADAILLIVRILDPVELKEYIGLCRELGMGALVEVHAAEEIEAAAEANAKIIGINNRDLSSFDTDVNMAATVAKFLAPGMVPVAASGISGPEDVKRLSAAGIFNFLIGESIVRSKDPKAFIKSLSQGL